MVRAWNWEETGDDESLNVGSSFCTQPLFCPVNNHPDGDGLWIKERKKFQKVAEVTRFFIQLFELAGKRGCHRSLLVKAKVTFPSNRL
jgi:hypothetical protein